LPLLLIAGLSYLVLSYMGERFLYTSFATDPKAGSLVLLPLVAFLISFLPRDGWLRVGAGCLATFLLFQDQVFGFYLFGIATIFYLVGKIWLGKDQPKVPSALPIWIALALAYIPFAIYVSQIEISKSQIVFLILFKSILAMRLISWATDRILYRQDPEHGFKEYLEYLYNPVFMLMPGQIQYVQYSYFHQSKSPSVATGRSWPEITTSLGLALWGLLAMSIFSVGSDYFWSFLFNLPGGKSGIELATIHFGFGLYWLVLIYFQQAGGMSFQVSVAREMGYNLKYDMHFPLLARSPIDYLRRHSSYVRDYIVHVGMRPIGLGLIRRNIEPRLAYLISAILSYTALVGVQVGYRADLERPLSTGLAMVGFLIVFLVLPFGGSLGEAIREKNVRDWNRKDVLAWILTICLLAIYKSILGLVR
jgi:hypothetical protein